MKGRGQGRQGVLPMTGVDPSAAPTMVPPDTPKNANILPGMVLSSGSTVKETNNRQIDIDSSDISISISRKRVAL